MRENDVLQRCMRLSGWKRDWELSEFVTNGQGLKHHPLAPANLEGRLESCLATQGMTLMSSVVRSPFDGCLFVSVLNAFKIHKMHFSFIGTALIMCL